MSHNWINPSCHQHTAHCLQSVVHFLSGMLYYALVWGGKSQSCGKVWYRPETLALLRPAVWGEQWLISWSPLHSCSSGGGSLVFSHGRALVSVSHVQCPVSDDPRLHWPRDSLQHCQLCSASPGRDWRGLLHQLLSIIQVNIIIRVWYFLREARAFKQWYSGMSISQMYNTDDWWWPQKTSQLEV